MAKDSTLFAIVVLATIVAVPPLIAQEVLNPMPAGDPGQQSSRGTASASSAPATPPSEARASDQLAGTTAAAPQASAPIFPDPATPPPLAPAPVSSTDALSEGAPTKAETDVVDPSEVAALREAYADLQRREAEVQKLTGPPSEETLNALRSTSSQAAEMKEALPMAKWKAETMEWFVGSITASVDLTLPEGTPSNMTQDLMLAGVQSGELYYSAPPFSKATVMGIFDKQTTVLRLADGSGVQLVWIPNVGFAFTTRQSLEFYR